MQPDVELQLYSQGLLWRDLIRGERAPADLQVTAGEKPPSTVQIWGELRLYEEAAGSLLWPLIAGALSIVLLAGGAALLAAGEGKTGLGTVVGILGALGLTSSGLYARAKAQITSLFTSLSQRVRIERIRQTADLCPPVDQQALPQPAPQALSPAAGANDGAEQVSPAVPTPAAILPTTPAASAEAPQ